jgi:hypothetical protein
MLTGWSMDNPSERSGVNYLKGEKLWTAEATRAGGIS